MNSAPVNSVLKQSSSLKHRQRSYPLNVRISETIDKQEKYSNEKETKSDTLPLSLPTESNEEQLKIIEINPNSTPVPFISTSTTPFTNENQDDYSEINLNKKSYRLILNSSSQIYRTIQQNDDQNQQQQQSDENNQQLTQLTLSQLELLEKYDPMISAKIGVPFIPVQMLHRPKDAHLSSRRSIQQIQNQYPKFESLFFL